MESGACKVVDTSSAVENYLSTVRGGATGLIDSSSSNESDTKAMTAVVRNKIATMDSRAEPGSNAVKIIAKVPDVKNVSQMVTPKRKLFISPESVDGLETKLTRLKVDQWASPTLRKSTHPYSMAGGETGGQ